MVVIGKRRAGVRVFVLGMVFRRLGGRRCWRSDIGLENGRTVVVLEVLLRNSIEGERGHRTLQARSCHTPSAVGAAPAAEVVAVDPDQVFVHTSPFCACRD